MKPQILVLSVFLSLYSSFTFARDWARVPIPGAYCGNGSEYSVFIDLKSKNKWAFEFMQGGACWSSATCWGPNLRTWIHQIPEIPEFSVLTTESSPLNDHSMVYFPYCTGDVYVGHHKASYFPRVGVYHYGGLNIELALEHLKKTGLTNPKIWDELVVYGASAGAIGSMFHAHDFDELMGKRKSKVKKKLLLDSPGLHFGKDFWEKFTPEQMEDFANAFDKAQMDVSFDDGNVAYSVKGFCENHSDWDIAIMQSTLDPVMSLIFGGITPQQHRRNFLGERGLWSILKDDQTCRLWSVDKPLHSFLILPMFKDLKDGLSQGESVQEFMHNFLNN